MRCDIILALLHIKYVSIIHFYSDRYQGAFPHRPLPPRALTAYVVRAQLNMEHPP